VNAQVRGLPPSPSQVQADRPDELQVTLHWWAGVVHHETRVRVDLRNGVSQLFAGSRSVLPWQRPQPETWITTGQLQPERLDALVRALKRAGLYVDLSLVPSSLFAAQPLERKPLFRQSEPHPDHTLLLKQGDYEFRLAGDARTLEDEPGLADVVAQVRDIAGALQPELALTPKPQPARGRTFAARVRAAMRRFWRRGPFPLRVEPTPLASGAGHLGAAGRLR
jgi:hypothetical protein